MSGQTGLIVSVSGIRGVVGEALTPSAVLAFASALGSHTNGGAMVVGRDGRPSGNMLCHAVLAGLTGQLNTRETRSWEAFADDLWDLLAAPAGLGTGRVAHGGTLGEARGS